jgi:CMP/dCMP kinase
MIITITGTPGSGKTSVAKELAKRLNMKYYSAGDIFEKIAGEKGLLVDELVSCDDETDHEVDGFLKKLGKTQDNIIVEGKAACIMIPGSFKILVTVDWREGVRRIFEDKKTKLHRTDEQDYSSIEEAQKILRARLNRLVSKFKRLYGIENFLDPSHFDFVLDTTDSPGPAQNADKIMEEMRKRGLIK